MPLEPLEPLGPAMPPDPVEVLPANAALPAVGSGEDGQQRR
jgi:hypothetical protein